MEQIIVLTNSEHHDSTEQGRLLNHSQLSLLVALFFLLIAPLRAQTPDTSVLVGQVLGQNSAPVAGVSVTLTNLATKEQRTTTTDDEGRFSLSALSAATYRFEAEKQNFAEFHREMVLIAGTTATIRLNLNLASVKTSVVVTGVGGETRADMPQLGNRLGFEQIEQTPLLNRRITNLPLLNAANRPALNQGDIFLNQTLFTSNGSGRRQTSWIVDGSSATDSWGRQTIFSSLPESAVQEMTVLENAFSAEYGATMGGVVNIVTKQGGSEYHGDLIAMWRPSATSAKLSGFTDQSATSGNQIVTDSVGQFAGSFSGVLPHSRDTRFFLAGEYTRQDRGSPVTSPVAPGVFVGHYAGWMSFLRLDKQLGPNNTLFLRANTDSMHDTNPNGAVGGNSLPSVDRIFRRRTYTTEIGENAILFPTMLNTIRAQFQLASPVTQFTPTVFGTQLVVPISSGGTFTSGNSQSALLLNRQYGFSDVLSSEHSRHDLKVGLDLIHAHTGGDSKEFGGPIYLGQLRYNTCTQDLVTCESAAYLNDIANVSSYSQSFGNSTYTVDDTLWALFVQDNFRVRRNLTLNLGVRYEQQTLTDARLNFAPRIGFAYDPRGNGSTVVRGGFGIYDGQVVDNSVSNYTLSGPTGVFNYTAGPGQIGFPESVADVPLPEFPAGAVAPVRSLYIRPGRREYYDAFFPTSVLKNYPDALLNPYTEQWTLGIGQRLGRNWILNADYLGAHTVHVVRPLDLDSPAPFVRTMPGQTRSAQEANCTRPLWVKFYSDAGRTCDPHSPNPPQPAYGVIKADVNDGWATYESLNANLIHEVSSRLTMMVSYVYSHTINNVDPDAPGGNPNDPNFSDQAEKGNAIFDQRHRAVLSGTYRMPGDFTVGGIATLASGLPFNFVTGTTNSGNNGGTTDRPVINSVVVPRNAGRGRATYDFSPFLQKTFVLPKDSLRVVARAESFNVFNHSNFVGYSGTYGNGATPGVGFGMPLTGITNQLPSRSLQFTLRFTY